MGKISKKKILAVESWDDQFVLKNRAIMKPMLEFAEASLEIKYSYHYLYTPTELSYTLKQFPAGNASLLYFALHGEPSKIKTGSFKEFEITLNSLSSFMGRRYEGYGVHFASCATLNGWQEDLLKFKEETGVAFVSGFSKYVDFNSSALVDLALISEWAYSRSYKRMFERLTHRHKRLFEENGFEYLL